MSFAGSSSLINGSLAWSLGNGGKGRVMLAFPFDMGWYHEQPCKHFRALEHRKEREGLEHEFIILWMTNGSICKLERTGDPNARLHALSAQGSVAHDFAQVFPYDTNFVKDARLDQSDIVAKIEFPEAFDLKCVLNICRAIHEAKHTRSYTLQVYNCYFFALAIQCCLTRFVAVSTNSKVLDGWLNASENAISASLRRGHQFQSSSIVSSPSPEDGNSSTLVQIYSSLTLGECNRFNMIQERISSQLRNQLPLHELTSGSAFRQHLERVLDQELWFSHLGSVPSSVLEQHVKPILLEDLGRAMDIGYSKLKGSDAKKSEWVRLGREQIKLVSQAKSGSRYNPGLQIRQHSEVYASPRPLRHIQVMDYRPASESPPQNLILDQLLSIYYGVFVKLWTICCCILILCGMHRFNSSPGPCTTTDNTLRILLPVGGYAQDFTNPKSRNRDARALAQDKPASHLKPPWAGLLADGVLAKDVPEEGLDTEVLAVSLKGGEMQPCSIKRYQSHALARIKDHAKKVESFGLGRAGTIRGELVSKLSEIWSIIREDGGPEDSLPGMRTMFPRPGTPQLAAVELDAHAHPAPRLLTVPRLQLDPQLRSDLGLGTGPGQSDSGQLDYPLQSAPNGQPGSGEFDFEWFDHPLQSDPGLQPGEPARRLPPAPRLQSAPQLPAPPGASYPPYSIQPNSSVGQIQSCGGSA